SPGLGAVLVWGGILFPLTGLGIAWLCGADLRVPAFLGLVMALGAMLATVDTWGTAERHVCHALTDRRLLIIKGLNKVEQFDVDLRPRLLAPTDARSAEGAADQHVLDVSKVRPLTARPAEGATAIEPILRMLRAFGQLQGTPKG